MSMQFIMKLHQDLCQMPMSSEPVFHLTERDELLFMITAKHALGCRLA